MENSVQMLKFLVSAAGPLHCEVLKDISASVF